MNGEHREENLTLGLLQAIDQRSDLTQRHLADRLGVALGLANAYLRRCIRKGLVKMKQAPANRYLYYLTPKGFAEKSQLTARYMRRAFDFYRSASGSVSRVFGDCQRAGFQDLVLCGVSELAEISLIRAREFPVRVVAMFDPACREPRYLGLPVWHDLDAGRFDACILTAITAPEILYRAMLARVPPGRILVPDLLGLPAETGRGTAA
ncbi:MAG: winged helix-turn-helix transcriptional regulator [Gammaproteobacteria bacterium]|nr:winged helix-turn-helix transcriptional regulator [Gammaproteobacteria bacterium]